jgi:hypothetical protein
MVMQMENIALNASEDEEKLKAELEKYDIVKLKEYSRIIEDILKSKYEAKQDEAYAVLAGTLGITPEEVKSRITNPLYADNKTNQYSRGVSKKDKSDSLHGYKDYEGYKVMPWFNSTKREVSRGAQVSWVQALKDNGAEQMKLGTVYQLQNKEVTLAELLEIDSSAVKVNKNDQWVNATVEDLPV